MSETPFDRIKRESAVNSAHARHIAELVLRELHLTIAKNHAGERYPLMGVVASEFGPEITYHLSRIITIWEGPDSLMPETMMRIYGKEDESMLNVWERWRKLAQEHGLPNNGVV
jgi:hypothetical protein